MGTSLRRPGKDEVFLERIVPIIASAVWAITVYGIRKLFGF